MIAFRAGRALGWVALAGPDLRIVGVHGRSRGASPERQPVAVDLAYAILAGGPLHLIFVTVTSLATSVPVLLVWTVGIALALANLQKGLSARLLLVGLGAMMVVRLATEPVYASLPMLASTYGLSITTVGQLNVGIGLATNLCNAGAWVLVIAAALLRQPEPLRQ